MAAAPARGTNVFTGNPIDRLGDRRRDEDFMAALLRRPDARLLPMRGSRHLVVRDGNGSAAARPRAADAPGLAHALGSRPAVLLGLLDDEPLIAIDLGEADADAPPPLPGTEFVDLRSAASTMPAAEAAMLAQARGYLEWRRTHLFCGRCGGGCEPIEGGAVLRCGRCAASHFPRTDPAVIMLVVRQDADGERALLARNARFGERRMFSTLAGFVEPGESLEETVRRETAEECGLRVRDVRYHSSQPWPFPASVMLGFIAATDDRELRIDGVEIIEAGFYTRAEMRAAKQHGFELPPATSIARRMIDDWCDNGV